MKVLQRSIARLGISGNWPRHAKRLPESVVIKQCIYSKTSAILCRIYFFLLFLRIEKEIQSVKTLNTKE